MPALPRNINYGQAIRGMDDLGVNYEILYLPKRELGQSDLRYVTSRMRAFIKDKRYGQFTINELGFEAIFNPLMPYTPVPLGGNIRSMLRYSVVQIISKDEVMDSNGKLIGINERSQVFEPFGQKRGNKIALSIKRKIEKSQLPEHSPGILFVHLSAWDKTASVSESKEIGRQIFNKFQLSTNIAEIFLTSDYYLNPPPQNFYNYSHKVIDHASKALLPFRLIQDLHANIDEYLLV
jgi:hypothetical protein